MFSLICLIRIGLQLEAPTWYFALLGIAGLCTVLNFGIKMYKAGTGEKK